MVSDLQETTQPGETGMRKLLQYGGIAASIVLIAFGIGADLHGFDGRSQVRSDLAARADRRYRRLDDPRPEGRHGCRGAGLRRGDPQAHARGDRRADLRPDGSLPRQERQADERREARRDQSRERQADRERPAQHVGQRDRALDRAQHGLLRRERRHLRDRHGLRPAAQRDRLPDPHPPGAEPGYRPQAGARAPVATPVPVA